MRIGLSLLAVAAFMWPAAEASALSCAPPDGPYSKYADVVFDGVLLSDSREEPLGRLVSPARMHVFRYLKGRGPRVVDIGTDVPVLTPGDDRGVFSTIPGLFEPYAGEVYRVYGDLPRGERSADGGVMTPAACGGTYARRTGTYLRSAPGSRVAERDATGRRWAAEYLRGTGGVRCVRLHPGPDPDAIECDYVRNYFRRTHRLLVALVPVAAQGWTTGLAIAGPDLESIVVEGPFGRVERPAWGPGRIALATLPGYFERADLTVRARFNDGTEKKVLGGGVIVQDPVRQAVLWGFSGTGNPFPKIPTTCVAFASRPDTSRPGFVFSGPRHGECGVGDLGFFAVRHSEQIGEGNRPVRQATLVFGMVPRDASRVTVTGPDGAREAARGSGGIFAAVYPPDVDHTELTVSFQGDSRGDQTFTGRRDWHVLSVPRSRLDRPGF